MRLFPVLACLAALAGCGSAPPPTVTAPASSMGASPSIPGLPTTASPSQPPLVIAHDPGMVTGGPYLSSCHTRDHGQLPDPACTPGSYDPAQTAVVICAAGYSTSSYRPSSSETTPVKYNVVELAYGQHHMAGELDHLVPLELGGSNDLANFWVEAGSIPNPKDAVENAIHRWVCTAPTSAVAQDRLRRAQLAVAADWLTAERRLGVHP